MMWLSWVTCTDRCFIQNWLWVSLKPSLQPGPSAGTELHSILDKWKNLWKKFWNEITSVVYYIVLSNLVSHLISLFWVVCLELFSYLRWMFVFLQVELFGSVCSISPAAVQRECHTAHSTVSTLIHMSSWKLSRGNCWFLDCPVLMYDIVADCSDNVPTRYLVNDACVLTGKPLVSASALRMEGQVGV